MNYYKTSYSDNIGYYNLNNNKNIYNKGYKTSIINYNNNINNNNSSYNKIYNYQRANTFNNTYDNINNVNYINTNLYNISYDINNNNISDKINSYDSQYNNLYNYVYKNNTITNPNQYNMNNLNENLFKNKTIIYNNKLLNNNTIIFSNPSNTKNIIYNNNIFINKKNTFNNNTYNNNKILYNSSAPNNNIIIENKIVSNNNIVIQKNENTNNKIIDNSISTNNSIIDNNIYGNNKDLFQYKRAKTQIIQESPLSFENKEKEIDKAVIKLVLSNTVEQYFVLKDFLKLKNEKDILNYFYIKEKICLAWLNQNFIEENNTKKFLKKLILDTIQHIYEGMEDFSKIRKKISTKLNKITDEIETKKVFRNIEQLYKDEFGTLNLPKFLTIDIDKSIENALYLEKFNKNYENMNNIYELNQMIIYYYELIRGEKRPFNIGFNNNGFFMILLYSNLKDISKSKKIKKIFEDNYVNFINCFNLINFDYNIFLNLINKNTNINGKENDLLEVYFNNYKKIQNFQIHLYILCSYFYLVMNIIRDTSDNYNTGAFMNIQNKIVEINLNNPVLCKILKNVINNFVKYSPCDKLNPSIYPYLINFLSNYIVIEDNRITKEKNKIYEITDFSYIISKSSLPDIKPEKYKNLINKLNKVESSNISIAKFLTKIKELFTENVYHEEDTNKISLSPLVLKRASNIITIFISGFGSEKENIYSWRNFIDFEPKFSNFYFFKWPSGNFAEMISFIPFSEKFVLEMPKKFINNKLKGKLAGKILGLFLASNEDFKKCQINLVGFSLGCHVIKYCVKELSKIKGVRNMINNVLFMGGAASISDKKNWNNIFKKVVGGRIINCYSKHDFVLDKLFKLCVDHTAIGTRQLIIKDDINGYNIIENYDLSDIKLGHLDYRKNFGKILKRINFY